MTGRLATRAARGLAWMGFGSGAQSLLQVAVLGVLARLVQPRDYGLVAAALLVTGLATIVAQGGIGQAVVQRRDLSAAHLRAGLTVAVGLALAAWVVLAVGAVPLSRFLDMDPLPPVLRIMGATLVLRSLTLGDVLLARRLAFRRLAIAEVTSYAVGYGAVAVVLALRGHGAWALVWGHVGQAAVRTALLWVLVPHPMRPLLAAEPARQLLGYGGGHTLARLGNWLAIQGDNLVVGRWLGPAALGLYSRAYQLMSMPAVLFGQVANDVLFPAMAEVQDDRRRLAGAYLLGVSLIALLTLPLAVLAALLSRELVLVLLGQRFAGTSAAFEVMAFGIMFRTGYKLADCVATATGAVYRRAWRQLCYALLVVGGAVVGQEWGIRGVAVGVLLALVVNFVLMAHLGMAVLGMPWGPWLRAHAPAALVATAALAGALPPTLALRAAAAPPLAILVAACCAALAAVAVLLRAAPLGRWGAGLAGLVGQLTALLPQPAALAGRIR